MKTREPIVYRVNGDDEITFVNTAWDSAALERGDHRVLSAEVLGKPLSNFISDPTTRELFDRIIVAARRGNRVEFQYRCDLPDERRVMKMSIRKLGGDGDVEFVSTLVSSEPRPSQAIFEELEHRTDEFLKICGWCQKVNVDQDLWLEVEEAVEALGLFKKDRLPDISHGICPACYAHLIVEIRQLSDK
ncbi:MAG TPA: hypothetical protein VL501_10165 [Pyrinomonadaceae bacterium]|nr:hypothetical protein [Pyrinomonadaceae bacterium]